MIELQNVLIASERIPVLGIPATSILLVQAFSGYLVLSVNLGGEALTLYLQGVAFNSMAAARVKACRGALVPLVTTIASDAKEDLVLSEAA